MGKKYKLLNKNSTPFLVLAVAHIVAVVILLRRSNQGEVWTLLLTNIGLTYLFELPTLNLFHGYRYKPRLFKQSIFDTILGAIYSQAVYVPITGTILSILKKNWIWKLSMAIIYYFIEVLFKRIHIYKVFWYKSSFTPVLIFLFFHISDWVAKALIQNKAWALKLAHYFSIEVVWITFMYVFGVFRKIRFGRKYYHTWTEHFQLAPWYSLVLSYTALVTSRWAKHRWLYPSFMIIIHMVIDKVLMSMGILKSRFKAFYVKSLWYLCLPITSRLLYKLIYHYRRRDYASMEA
ncbi:MULTISPECIES: hypothetical protein [Bacillaceae]|uniref:Uncharacterized protein n=1 Tax=Evansella alkalicola TaxID=745819 RepID=A0ABS6JXM9_9BACI|nr:MULTISPECIES: hypothetical protein [Bacillaceae]MBU9723354.1 hypothetical protein [Bacillus alkalicola]